MQTEWIQALVITVASIGSAATALMIASFLPARLPIGRARGKRSAPLAPAAEPTVFLFDDHQLVDATASARALLARSPSAGSDWARFNAFAAPRFAHFAQTMATLDSLGRIELTEEAPPVGRAALRIVAEHVGGFARLTLIDPEAEGIGVVVDGLSLRAIEDELELSRALLDALPAPTWRETAEGAVDWANRAYLSLVRREDDEGVAWPMPVLFGPAGAPGETARVAIHPPAGGDAAFDAHHFPFRGGSIRFAFPADATVRAEQSRREFIQTLSKTFADLPIGLAVFDRARRLQLFNPALGELTRLPAEFLIQAPTLYAFLDRMREAGTIPEPRDYRSWRRRLIETEKAAAQGAHSETWALADGLTYRITGRPHPDGALAFLIEDVTSEVSLARRFRAEIELGQEILDGLDNAVAAFDATGAMTLANAPYERLWRAAEPTLGAELGPTTLRDQFAQWRRECVDPAALETFWREGCAERAASVRLRLRNGGQITLRRRALAAGGTLAAFSTAPQVDEQYGEARAKPDEAPMTLP